MLTATIDGKEVTLAPEQLKLPEGYALVTPDAVPDGLMRQTVVESMIAQRVSDAKRNALKDADKDDTIKTKVLEQFGIRLEGGKPVGVPAADVEQIKRSIHAEIKAETDKEVKPIRQQNKVLSQRLLTGEIKAAAATAGMKSAFVEMFAKTYAESFGIDAEGNVYQRDGDGFKLDPSTGANVTPSKFIEAIRKDPNYADFFANTQQRGGLPTPGQSVNLGGVKSKADLKTAAEKSAYIAQFGTDNYLKLPSK